MACTGCGIKGLNQRGLVLSLSGDTIGDPELHAAVVLCPRCLDVMCHGGLSGVLPGFFAGIRGSEPTVASVADACDHLLLTIRQASGVHEVDLPAQIASARRRAQAIVRDLDRLLPPLDKTQQPGCD